MEVFVWSAQTLPIDIAVFVLAGCVLHLAVPARGIVMPASLSPSEEMRVLRDIVVARECGAIAPRSLCFEAGRVKMGRLCLVTAKPLLATRDDHLVRRPYFPGMV